MKNCYKKYKKRVEENTHEERSNGMENSKARRILYGNKANKHTKLHMKEKKVCDQNQRENVENNKQQKWNKNNIKVRNGKEDKKRAKYNGKCKDNVHAWGKYAHQCTPSTNATVKSITRQSADPQCAPGTNATAKRSTGQWTNQQRTSKVKNVLLKTSPYVRRPDKQSKASVCMEKCQTQIKEFCSNHTPSSSKKARLEEENIDTNIERNKKSCDLGTKMKKKMECQLDTPGADVLKVAIDGLMDKASIHLCRDEGRRKVEKCTISIENCTGDELTSVSIVAEEIMKVTIAFFIISFFLSFVVS